jgi:hypothetical protein
VQTTQVQFQSVPSDKQAEPIKRPNPWTGEDVAGIVRHQGWMPATVAPDTAREIEGWCERAADLLGPHAPDSQRLTDLLTLVFDYDAAALLGQVENQDLLAGADARELIRELAHRVLDGTEIDSDRYKAIIDELKRQLRCRGREFFFPLRLALAGRAGQGELDRVILLLDWAAKLPFAAKVKGTKQRMLEFCTALD